VAQSTVVTTATGAGHAAAVQIEPEYCAKIHTHVTEHAPDADLQEDCDRPARAAPS
jgi:hypothetical protein